MAHYAVRESPPLRGEIPISTSKNAVLPIMCGALLTGEDVRIERVPELTDVKTLCALLASCGCSVKKEGDALVLNAGAALILAGLCAEGETLVDDSGGHIERGYCGIEEKLRAVGGRIERVAL